MTSPSSAYTPGVCNIGPAEIAKRRIGGWLGLALTALLLVFLQFTHSPRPARLFAFVPLLLASVGFLQAQMHFCVAYGFAGMAKVMTADGKSDTVEQAAFRSVDRKRALMITGLSILVAAAATAVIDTIP